MNSGSGTWIKGARCGIDNCRSRYYRSIDGRRICQYGHVNESHIEFNDEEDEFQEGTFTKRLKMGGGNSQLTAKARKQSERSRIKLHGEQGKELYIRCMQYILRRQTEVLIEVLDLPETFTTVIKNLWAHYMQRGISRDGHDLYEWLVGELGKGYSRENVYPDLIDLLALLIIGFRYMNLPIYCCDMIALVGDNTIPFLNSWNYLPKAMQERLVHISVIKFKNEKLPNNNQLYQRVSILVSNMQIKGITLNHEPLVLKFINRLCLPIRTFTIVQNMIKTRGIVFSYDFIFSKKDKTAVTLLNPELHAIALVVAAAKFLFISGSIIEEEEEEEGQIIDPGVHGLRWKEAYLAYRDNTQASEALDFVLAEINQTENTKLYDWSDAQVEKYLDWFKKKMVGDQTKRDISRRRLNDLFPLDIGGSSDNKEEEESKKEEEKERKPLKNKQIKLSEIQTIKDVQKYLTQSSAQENNEPLTRRIFDSLESFLLDEIHLLSGCKRDLLLQISNIMESRLYDKIDSRKAGSFIKSRITSDAGTLRIVFDHKEAMTCKEINDIMKKPLGGPRVNLELSMKIRKGLASLKKRREQAVKTAADSFDI